MQKNAHMIKDNDGCYFGKADGKVGGEQKQNTYVEHWDAPS